MALMGFDADGNWFDIDEGITIMCIPDSEYDDIVRDLKAGKHLDPKRRHRYALSYVEAVMEEHWPEESCHGESLKVLDYFTQIERTWKVVKP